MKYLKLYENFNKYDFKRYTGADMFRVYNELEKQDLSDSDFDRIKNVIPFVKRPENQKVYRYLFAEFYTENDQMGKYFYKIFSLTDYCYMMMCVDLEVIEPVWIETFDDIEPLLSELMIYKSNIITENIDRYSFGKYSHETDDLTIILSQFNPEDISIDDYIKIRSIIPEMGASRVLVYDPNKHTKHMYVKFERSGYDEMYNEIHYLGDYCYGLVTRDHEYELETIEIFDDIDSLLNGLEKISKEDEVS